VLGKSKKAKPALRLMDLIGTFWEKGAKRLLILSTVAEVGRLPM